MVKVDVHRHHEAIVYVRISGHAGSGDYGKDLVCAGVSTVSVGCLNSLEHFGFFDQESGSARMEEGLVEIQVHNVGKETQVVLETLVISLKTMEKSYKKYVKILEEEVSNYDV